MKIVKKLKAFYEAYLECPNDMRFDTEIHLILKYLHYFGFYIPKPTVKRKIYGVVMFILSIVTVLLGCGKELWKGIHEKDMAKSLIYVMQGFIVSSMMIQILSLMKNREELESLIESLHTKSANLDEIDFDKIDAMRTLRKNCLRIVKGYTYLLIIYIPVQMMMRILSMKLIKLIMVAVYDELANGFLFFIFLAINFVHTVCFILTLVACDLLHILLMIRIEAKIKFLCHDLRQCTDNESIRDNAEELKLSVAYHNEIIE